MIKKHGEALLYLYSIVVFPAPSNPKIKILVSFVPNKPENILENRAPENKEGTLVK